MNKTTRNIILTICMCIILLLISLPFILIPIKEKDINTNNNCLPCENNCRSNYSFLNELTDFYYHKSERITEEGNIYYYGTIEIDSFEKRFSANSIPELFTEIENFLKENKETIIRCQNF